MIESFDTLHRVYKIKKGRSGMKSDIEKFRSLSRVASAVMVLVACSFVCCMAFCVVGETIATVISLTAMLIFGTIATMLESAAHGNLICPKCGKRLLEPLREAYTKENRACYLRIANGEPVECMHCVTQVS